MASRSTVASPGLPAVVTDSRSMSWRRLGRPGELVDEF
jgi:hypothetical protein